MKLNSSNTMTKIYFSLLLLSSLFVFQSVKSQISYDFGFIRSDSIIVLDSLGNQMDFPWVGGLNSVHFQEIDLNIDGLKDLLVFDTHGDKKYNITKKNKAAKIE